MKKLSLPASIKIEDARNIAKQASAIKHANEFYYNETYGQRVKKILDTVHSKQKPVQISDSDYSVSTLRIQFYQGARYLIDHFDPENIYAGLYARTICVTEASGIIVRPRRNPRETGGLLSFSEIADTWKEELGTFLENASPFEKFQRDNLSLTDEDKSWIAGQLAGLTKTAPDGSSLPLFFGEVTDNKIMLIRDEN